MSPSGDLVADSERLRTVPGMPAGADPTNLCDYPIRLRRRALDMATGEVNDSTVHRRCGTRLESSCPSCSALYKGDAWQLISSGLYDADGNQRLATWVTLTAPGAEVFGPTHSQRRNGGKGGAIRRCRCGSYHNDGDALIGQPLDPTTYRYDLAADFNANASRLAAVTWQKLSRILGRKIQVVRVMEYQTRGLLHVHALVLDVVTDRTLAAVVRGGTNLRTGRTIRPATSGGWTWGTQFRAERVASDAGRRLGYYMSKVIGYAVKGAGDGAPAGPHADKMEDAGMRSCTCGHPSPDCLCGDDTFPVERSDGSVERHRYQTKRASRPCRRHRAAARGWGFRGHVLSASRGWGLTFRELRERRQAWRGAQVPATASVEVTWTVEGRGWGPDGLRSADFVGALGGDPPPGGAPPLMT